MFVKPNFQIRNTLWDLKNVSYFHGKFHSSIVDGNVINLKLKQNDSTHYTKQDFEEVRKEIIHKC